MKKICLTLLSLCSVVSAANVAQAACSTVTCAELGYSKSDVVGCKSYIYCPLDTSYKACYSYRTYTSGTCPTGANCDMRYKITKCPSGYVLNMAKTECVKSTKCNIGYYMNPNANECMICPAGTYGPDGVDCADCPAGSYSDTDGVAACTKCPAGTYQDGVGKDTCKICSTSTTVGATSCTSTCDSSYSFGACPDGATCASCGGKYKVNSCHGCYRMVNTKVGTTTVTTCSYQSSMNKASMCWAIGTVGDDDFCTSDAFPTESEKYYCQEVQREYLELKARLNDEEDVQVICDTMCPSETSCQEMPCP